MCYGKSGGGGGRREETRYESLGFNHPQCLRYYATDLPSTPSCFFPVPVPYLLSTIYTQVDCTAQLFKIQPPSQMPLYSTNSLTLASHQS